MDRQIYRIYWIGDANLSLDLYLHLPYQHNNLYLLPWTGHEGVTDIELVSEDEDKTEMKAKHSNRERVV